MKKIIFILLVVLPVLTFGQNERIALKKIEITKSMKILPIKKENNIETIFSSNIPCGFAMYENGKCVLCLPSAAYHEKQVRNQKQPIFVIDGIPMDNTFNLNSLSIEDIEDISILKDPALARLDIKDPIILITTKKKTEYETIVFAPGYETFLTTQKSKDFYSESYLKTKNIQMVNEWNYRYKNTAIYNPKIYEASIDYNTSTDYGIDVEYELYMFFRFMEKENKMSLIQDKMS